MNKEKWLSEDESLEFVKEENCKGIVFQIYMDDYGQSYHLAWRDPNTNEINSWCCGTYNDYEINMQDIADNVLASKGVQMKTRTRTPSEIKEDILNYFNDYKQWYVENILRDHVTDILKDTHLEADIDTCEVIDEDGKTVPLDWFIEILYERIMQNIENVIACTEETIRDDEGDDD